MKAQTLITSLLRKSPLRASATIDKCSVPRSVAAVACIIKIEVGKARIQPPGQTSINHHELLASLLSRGDDFKASMLFIKRAVRKGDRYSGDGEYFIVFREDLKGCTEQLRGPVARLTSESQTMMQSVESVERRLVLI